ncbi:MAG: carboxypeptidase regulatory-like domain-containing protein [Dehalococcoidia bacterium]
MRSALSGVNGSYQLTNLPAGRNHLRVFDRTGRPLALVDDVLDLSGLQGTIQRDLLLAESPASGEPSPPPAAEPTPPPTGRAPMAGILATGQITGIVTAADSGLPVSGVTVWAYDATGSIANTASTNASGLYSLSGLQPGPYRILFRPNTGGYLQEYYNNVSDLASATLVNLPDGGTVVNINASLDKGSRVFGRVTAADGGAGLAGVQVSVSGSGANTVFATTDASGNYTTNIGLYSGSYTVRFTPPSSGAASSYIPEYHLNAASQTFATPLIITSSANITNLDAVLDRGAVLTGTVTAADGGAPLDVVNVYVYDAAGSTVASAATTSGVFTTSPGIPPGSYRIFYQPSGGDASAYLSEYRSDKPDLASADPFVIPGSGIFGGFDAVLTRGGLFGGMVTAEDGGAPLANVSVSVYDAAGNQVAYAYTGANGVYTSTGVAPGNYRLQFSPSTPYVPEFHLNKPNLQAADPVALAGVGVTTVNAALALGGVLTGTVTAADGGAPLAGVGVTAYSTTWNWLGSSTTTVSGVYTVTGLPPGQVFIQFSPNSNSLSAGYLGEYYDNQPVEAPTPVTIAVGTPAVANAVLERGSVVTGRVTADGSGSMMTGRVPTADSGAPLPNVNVTIYDAAGRYIVGTSTRFDGSYRTPRIGSGSYRAYFSPSSSSPSRRYLAEYHQDKPTLAQADPVTVTVPTVATVDAALAAGGQIAGRVTAADSGAGLAGVNISVQTPAGSQVGSAFTDLGGYYTSTAVATGNYLVRFTPSSGGAAQDYISEYFNDKPTRPLADAVTVNAGAITGGVNAALARGGTISGRVTAADGGAGLVDVFVDAFGSDGSYISGGTTDGAGNYTIRALPPGSYRISFSPWLFGPARQYIPEFYNDQRMLETANPVVLPAMGAVPGIDAVLTRGGELGGRVTAADTGLGLDNIYVVVNQGDQFVGSSYTDASGSYTVTALLSGTYQVAFLPPSSGPGSFYVSEWYSNQVSAETANPVAVTAPNAVPGINAVLDRGGFVGGRVTGETSGTSALAVIPLAGVAVYVYNATGNTVANGTTNATGHYTATPALRSGSYKVEFLPLSNGPSRTFIGEYYNDKADFSMADPVAVTSPAMTPVDAVLTEGGTITGRVTGADSGLGLQGVSVYAYNNTGNNVRSTTTDASGVYTLTGIPLVPVRIQFSPTSAPVRRYIGEYYNDSPDGTTAVRFTLASGETRSGIDAVLAPGGTITGRVTGADSGLGLQGVTVQVYRNGSYSIGTTTNVNGVYTATGLLSGTYAVYFYPSSAYLPEYYNDMATLATATPVPVTAPDTVSGIDAALTRGNQITGRVTAADTGLTLADVFVNVYTSDGAFAASGTTGVTGVYTTVPGLLPGSYRVAFNPSSTPPASGYIPEYYNDKATLAASDPVTVAGPGTTTGIDAVLARGGSISGRVTAVNTGQPVRDVSVNVYDANGTSIASGYTDSNGQYLTVPGVPAGAYRVQFQPSTQSGYFGEWYNDKGSLATADPVAVTVGNVTSGIDAQIWRTRITAPLVALNTPSGP